jgi:tetratricopeptide (TPR) repeat protein
MLPPIAASVGVEPAPAQVALGANPTTQALPTLSVGPRTRVLTGEAAFQVALRLFVERGDWDGVLKLLDALPAERRADQDVLLIEAQAFRRLGQPKRALDIYRKLLGRRGNAQGLRLELAQTFYEARDLQAADYNFRLALAGALPDADRRLAHAYLAKIAQERPWRVTGTVSIAPDSNLNGATDTREVQILGLPFSLSDEARRQAGWAASGFLQADGGVSIGSGRKLVGALYGAATETQNSAFDSQTAGARLGPEFAHGEDRWSIQATGERQWYGGRALYDAVGLAVQAQFARGPVTAYAVALTTQHLNFDVLNTRDGWLSGLDVQRNRFLSPDSFWRSGFSLRYNQAAAPSETFGLISVDAGYYRSLPLGLAVYVQPTLTARRYGGPDPYFGVLRQDREVAVSVRLIKQDYSFWGFAPYVGALLDRNWSNVPLYDYSRERGEVGVSRTF